MSSVVRSIRRRKQRRLGRIEIVPRESYQELELNSRVELIRSLIPLGLMHVQELLEEEVGELAGARYERKDGGSRGTRHGSNPGSVQLAGQRLAIRVPRVRGETGELALKSYGQLHGGGELDEGVLRRVLYGISCRDYEAAAQAVPGAIGLSSSTVSRQFIRASAARLQALQERDLADEDIVVIFLDGKAFAEDMLVVALGVTLSGEKRFLGFVETGTENEKVLTPFLRSLLERGLDISRGVLVVMDGGKGLRAAVRNGFERLALVQRCQWHKRENVVQHLPVKEQPHWRRRLQSAYHRATYAKARKALLSLRKDLAERNESAASSLDEGLEETLTLHRLGVFEQLGASLKTTNCLESVNAVVEQRCAKVDRWRNSNQRRRWLASTLLDIEPRLRRVKGHRYLPMLRAALQRELGLSGDEVQKAA